MELLATWRKVEKNNDCMTWLNGIWILLIGAWPSKHAKTMRWGFTGSIDMVVIHFVIPENL